MDVLHLVQEDVYAKIKNSLENFKKKGKANMTPASIEQRRSRTQEYWTTFKENHYKMLELLVQEPSLRSTHAYFIEDMFSQAEDAYSSFLEEISFLEATIKASNEETQNGSNGDTGSASLPKLPHIPLPSFNGSSAEWRSFRDLFKALVLNRTDISNVEKFYYLRACVDGEAKQLIAPIALTEENLTVVWELLKEHYDYNKLVLFQHFGELVEAKPMTRENSAELKRVFNLFYENVGALKSLGCPVSNWDFPLSFLLLRLLDSKTRRAWESCSPKNPFHLSYKDIMHFLQNQLRILLSSEPSSTRDALKEEAQRLPVKQRGSPVVRSVLISKSSNLSTPNKSNNAPHNLNQSTASSFSPCPKCTERHPLYLCDQFLRMDVGDRIQFVEGLSLCTNCLRLTEGVLAQKTSLGWVISGVAANKVSTSGTSLTCSCSEQLLTSLQRFWSQEDISTQEKGLSEDEKECEEHFQRTHVRLPGGRYMVRLPFSKPPSLLGKSDLAAANFFYQLEARLKRNSSYKALYSDFIEEYKKLGFLKKSAPPFHPFYFIPHHGIFKPQSDTTKLRVVFNASHISSTGLSLNDILHPGPSLINNLDTVLLKWRQFRVAFTADIEKMYCQVQLHPEDQKLQRIWWRCNPSDPLEVLQMTTVTFGLKCSPFLAIRALRQLASDEEGGFPKAKSIVANNMYVDDLLLGGDTVEEALHLQRSLFQFFKLGHFNLRKWRSSHWEVIQNLPPDLQSDDLDQTWHANTDYHTLGLRWNVHQDAFSLVIGELPQESSWTKRKVLKRVAQLFDPLGFFSPVTVKAKIFLQTLWSSNLVWDDPIPEKLTSFWKCWYHQLDTLSQVQLPRWLGTTSHGSFALHGFADASQEAYAAVVYLTTSLRSGKYESVLVAAKTKVAPLQKISIPRLELNAALLLSRLIHKILENLDRTPSAIHLWTDSRIVLCWISSPSSRWKTYVANRVSNIQSILPTATWRHVASVDNPADIASRGLLPGQIPSADLWWQGPSWISTDVFPASSPPEETSLEMVAESTCQVAAQNEREMETWVQRFSSLRRLFNDIARCRRWLPSMRQERSHDIVSYAERCRAEQAVIRLVQEENFAAEILALQQNLRIPSASKLVKLNPFLDHNNILRVGGRLDLASVNEKAKHPILLPKESHLSELIFREIHETLLHAGPTLMLSVSRQSYWILAGRSLARSLLRKCVKCLRFRAGPLQQQMGNLPRPRVVPSRPFSHTGIDYAGPLLVKSGITRKAPPMKAYIALFICLATKAIHLELVPSYSAESFIAAFRRFVSRRGICLKLYSDQGTTFVGAERELRNLHRQALDDPAIQRYFAETGISWSFNPPAAPHFGGLWEAGVKSVNGLLRKSMNNTLLTYEELTTLLTQIEACLNSKPLSPISDDPNDISVLTPSHFLVGEPLSTLPEPDSTLTKVNLLKRWQLVLQKLAHFWKRWSQEYLHQLQTRSKWFHPTPLKTGDIVVLMKENTPPARWPLARVIQLHPDADGLTRVVTLRTQQGDLRRPIHKLVGLLGENH